MFERIKRWPIVAWFLRKKYPYNSTCGICKLPWSVCEIHSIPIGERNGFFPTCQWCWEHKSKSANKGEVIRLWTRWWLTKEGSPYTLQEMLDAFEKDWKLTHEE